MQVANGYRPPIPGWVPASVAAVIQACWEDDPDVRPTAGAVVEMLQAIVASGEDGKRVGVGTLHNALRTAPSAIGCHHLRPSIRLPARPPCVQGMRLRASALLPPVAAAAR